MANDIVIQTHQLSKSFGKVHALQSLDLTVKRNTIVGFLGPNGAGKTTTIKLLLGLIRPSSGRATVFGQDIGADSVPIRSRTGYLPQEPRYFEYMTAREVVEFTARFFFKGPRRMIADRAAECLDLVGLHEKADRPIKGFSGGERQRLGIAQAQINYPDLLILDEPAAALDPIGRRDVLEIMEKLRKYTTIFYSTHILDDVQRVSDSVVILNRGRLVTTGPIEELLASSEGSVYLIKLKGDVDSAGQSIRALPWVTGVSESHRNHESHWQVTVSDEQTAEEMLLRVLVTQPVVVTEFRRKQIDLEDVFMQVVHGGEA